MSQIDLRKIEEAIAQRLQKFENEINARFFAAKENETVRDELLLQDSISKMNDFGFYNYIKGNQISVDIERITKEISFARKSSEMVSKALKKIGSMPAYLKEEEIKGLLLNKERKKALDEARKDILSLLEKRTKPYAHLRKKLVKKHLGEEERKLEKISDSILEVLIDAEVLREEIAEKLERIGDLVTDESINEEKMETYMKLYGASSRGKVLWLVNENKKIAQRRFAIHREIELMKTVLKSKLDESLKLANQIAPIERPSFAKELAQKEETRRIIDEVFEKKEERKLKELEKTGKVVRGNFGNREERKAA